MSSVAGSLIRAGEARDFILVKDAPSTETVRNKLNVARFQLRFQACFCSVLDHCWLSDLHTLDPKPVDRCPTPKTPYKG